MGNCSQVNNTTIKGTSAISYDGTPLPCTDVNTCDGLNTILKKFDDIICNVKADVDIITEEIINITEDVMVITEDIININNQLGICCPTTTTTSSSTSTSTTSTTTSSTSTTTTTTTAPPCNCVTFYNGSISSQEITYIDCNGVTQYDLINIGATNSYCGCCGQAPTPDVIIIDGPPCVLGVCPIGTTTTTSSSTSTSTSTSTTTSTSTSTSTSTTSTSTTVAPTCTTYIINPLPSGIHIVDYIDCFDQEWLIELLPSDSPVVVCIKQIITDSDPTYTVDSGECVESLCVNVTFDGTVQCPEDPIAGHYRITWTDCNNVVQESSISIGGPLTVCALVGSGVTQPPAVACGQGTISIGGPCVQEGLISPTSDATDACPLSMTTSCWITGTGDLNAGDVVYTDAAMTTLFVGDGNYYHIQLLVYPNSYSAIVDSNGVIQSTGFTICP